MQTCSEITLYAAHLIKVALDTDPTDCTVEQRMKKEWIFLHESFPSFPAHDNRKWTLFFLEYIRMYVLQGSLSSWDEFEMEKVEIRYRVSRMKIVGKGKLLVAKLKIAMGWFWQDFDAWSLCWHNLHAPAINDSTSSFYEMFYIFFSWMNGNESFICKWEKQAIWLTNRRFLAS